MTGQHPATSLLGRLRRYPLTAGYTALLLLTGLYLDQAAPERVSAIEAFISTNLDNLASHPVRVLLLSVVAASPGYRWLYVGLVTLTLGLCEQWLGWWRTLAIYLSGNFIATLLVAAWIEHALATGQYAASIRSTSDFGVSYGLNTLVFTLVARPPKLWQNLLAAGAALGWLYLQSPWHFTTQEQYYELGHLIASALGLLLAGGILARRVAGRTGDRNWLVPAEPRGALEGN